MFVPRVLGTTRHMRCRSRQGAGRRSLQECLIVSSCRGYLEPHGLSIAVAEGKGRSPVLPEEHGFAKTGFGR
ncbi:uncharacterized protein J3R85_012365 [Psidium guajava]|nr:uncharacterized protein J3R85_012365 [Psidium guajava]